MKAIKELFFKVIKSSTFSTLGVMVGVNMIGTVLQGLGGILQARWVSPEMFGEFRKYGIVTSYLAFLMVFVQDGLMRQFPYYMGQGKEDKAIACAAVAKYWYIVFAWLLGGGFVVLSLWAMFRRDYIAAAGWGVQIVMVVQGTFGTFVQTIYRRSLEFKRLSYNNLVASIYAFVSLVLIKFWGYYGLALRQVTVTLVQYFFNLKYIPVKIKMKWNWLEFKELAKISIPISIYGYIRTSLETAVFGTLAIKYCGAEGLGLFGVASSFEGVAKMFTGSLIQIFYVKMANKFGETGSVKKSLRAFVLPTVLGVLAAIVLAGLLCGTVGPFIRLVTPKYVKAIPIVYVLSLTLPLTILAMPLDMLKTALQYKRCYILSIAKLLALVAYILLSPRTLIHFAWAGVAGWIVNILIGYWYLYLECTQKETA